jgi:hypothetical protein
MCPFGAAFACLDVGVSDSEHLVEKIFSFFEILKEFVFN